MLLVSLPARKHVNSDWPIAWLIDAASLVGLASQCLCMIKLLSQSTWWHFVAPRESRNFLVGYILAHRLEVVQARTTLYCIKILIFALSFLMVIFLTHVPLPPPPITYQ